MHVFDALIMLQLLVSNIYARVTPDNIYINFGLRMEKITKFSSGKYVFAVNSPNFPIPSI